MAHSPWITLILIACAAAAVGAFLYTIAARIAWEIGLHNLRVESHRLRIEYAKRLAMLRGEGPTEEEQEINVDILGDDGEAIEMGELVEEPVVPAEPRRAA